MEVLIVPGFFLLAGIFASVFTIWGLIKAFQRKDKFMIAILLVMAIIIVYSAARIFFF
jgi:hypothetical protein